MTVRNPNDSILTEILEELRQLRFENPLRAAAVESGMTRYYGGSTLRIEDSNLEVSGEAFIAGVLRVVGRIALEGMGVLSVEGLIELLGRMRVSGGGGITVEGGGGIEVNGGVIRAGNVRIEDGKITVGVGSAAVTIDGATGEIVSGALTIDPTEDGGAVLFDNGSKMYSNETAIGLRNGNTSLTIGDALASLLSGGKSITVAEDGITLGGIREVTSADGVKWLGITGSGEVVIVAPGVGGPGASLTWPFPPSTVTSEYGPREVTVEGASAFHLGIDFGVAGGTPIPAAGAGRVTFAGPNGGYGNHVRIDHGGGLETTYSHMQTLPTVFVGQIVPRGWELGPVGDTGTSGGNHLHFEVIVNGNHVNPRSKLPAA